MCHAVNRLLLAARTFRDHGCQTPPVHRYLTPFQKGWEPLYCHKDSHGFFFGTYDTAHFKRQAMPLPRMTHGPSLTLMLTCVISTCQDGDRRVLRRSRECKRKAGEPAHMPKRDSDCVDATELLRPCAERAVVVWLPHCQRRAQQERLFRRVWDAAVMGKERFIRQHAQPARMIHSFPILAWLWHLQPCGVLFDLCGGECAPEQYDEPAQLQVGCPGRQCRSN